jgi:hypothetical protein
MVGFYAALRPQNDAAPLADFATALNNPRTIDDHRKAARSLQRYGGTLRERLCSFELHHVLGHDLLS